MSWNGGFYATPTMAGSRAGNVIAGGWTAIMKTGYSGYLENAKLILTACSSLKKAVRAELPEIVVATQFDTCVVTLIGKN